MGLFLFNAIDSSDLDGNNQKGIPAKSSAVSSNGILYADVNALF